MNHRPLIINIHNFAIFPDCLSDLRTEIPHILVNDEAWILRIENTLHVLDLLELLIRLPELILLVRF